VSASKVFENTISPVPVLVEIVREAVIDTGLGNVNVEVVTMFPATVMVPAAPAKEIALLTTSPFNVNVPLNVTELNSPLPDVPIVLADTAAVPASTDNVRPAFVLACTGAKVTAAPVIAFVVIVKSVPVPSWIVPPENVTGLSIALIVVVAPAFKLQPMFVV